MEEIVKVTIKVNDEEHIFRLAYDKAKDQYYLQTQPSDETTGWVAFGDGFKTNQLKAVHIFMQGVEEEVTALIGG